MTQLEAHSAAADTQAVIRVHPDDDVVTALRPIDAGERLEVGAAPLQVREAIAQGHKLAVRSLARGAIVRKFGRPIGQAKVEIVPGALVHTHNLGTRLAGLEDYRYQPAAPAELPTSQLTFRGYRRGDGRVGTRNEIWILPTVGCVARTAQRIAEAGRARHGEVVDGIHAFAHPFGCSQLGDDLDGTRSLLASLACHPNAGGVLLLGLGCESNQLDALLEEIPAALRARVRAVAAQANEDEVAAGVEAIDTLVAAAAGARRSEASLADLAVGLKCGGSDGLSGLTANPLVGRIADLVNGSRGATILTEIPEIFGAERDLMARASGRAVFEAIAALVNDFKRYYLDHGLPVSENPSPGNLAGGITTLEEKSLGAAQKAGSAAVTDVLRYGERIRGSGLSLLEAPGNDAVSSTALAAAGATVILFTTGRGTPLGTTVPTLKIASNSALAARKPGWTDFDAGQVLADGFDRATESLLARVVAVASGEPTAAERNDERELAIWKRGVTL